MYIGNKFWREKRKAGCSLVVRGLIRGGGVPRQFVSEGRSSSARVPRISAAPTPCLRLKRVRLRPLQVSVGRGLGSQECALLLMLLLLVLLILLILLLLMLLELCSLVPLLILLRLIALLLIRKSLLLLV